MPGRGRTIVPDKRLFVRTGSTKLVFVVATGGGVGWLILPPGIRIETTLEREKISEELERNQMHESSKPFRCFGD